MKYHLPSATFPIMKSLTSNQTRLLDVPPTLVTPELTSFSGQSIKTARRNHTWKFFSYVHLPFLTSLHVSAALPRTNHLPATYLIQVLLLLSPYCSFQECSPLFLRPPVAVSIFPFPPRSPDLHKMPSVWLPGKTSHPQLAPPTSSQDNWEGWKQKANSFCCSNTKTATEGRERWIHIERESLNKEAESEGSERWRLNDILSGQVCRFTVLVGVSVCPRG